MKKRVLIIGGTGVFGRRLAQHLSDFESVELVVSSRNMHNAEQLAATLGENTTGVALDTESGLNTALDSIKPWAVIDCSGPFQSAGYETARVVLHAGAHMIDLADARDYLLGYSEALDKDAKQMKVAAITGASSTPALSMAVVRKLTTNWNSVHSVDICITPGGKSEVGEAVIRAVLSYAGQDIPVWKDGHLSTVKGWVGSDRINIPGLGQRRVSPVETADAELLGNHFPDLQHVSFKAGLESRIEHFGMNALATLRAWGIAPNLQPLAPLLKSTRNITRLTTSDCGGMMVEVRGTNEKDQPISARWVLVAKNNHGPKVPILATAAVVRLLLKSEIKSGAHLASNTVPLEAIEHEMALYDITTQINVDKQER